MARLSAGELRRMLKEQLDDPAVSEITDERLLVKGILDTLLVESSDYASCYRVKAQKVVLDVYEAVQAGRLNRVPSRFWEGEQGLLNAGIVLRPIIGQHGWLTDRRIFEQFNKAWMERKGLSWLCSKHGLYRLLIAAYPEYAFDPKRPWAFHLHPWDIGYVKWSESLIREAVRHSVYFHMPWGISLREIVRRFTIDFIRSENLFGILTTRFDHKAYNLFIFGFPEYVFDQMHPDRSHIHYWDAPHTSWSDNLVREAVQHMVKYHTDWQEDKLVSNVTISWLNEIGLSGISSLSPLYKNRMYLLRHVYPALFERETLSEDQFKSIKLGKGIARFRHPLRSIPGNYQRIRVEKTLYYFAQQYRGLFFHKLSKEYGILYTLDKRPVGLFKWNTDPSVRYVRIRQKDLVPVPPELTQPQRHLAFADAVHVLADEVQIVVYALPLKDQTALTEALNTVQPAQVVDYLKLTGETGLRAMADTEFYAALVQIHGSFDPVSFRQVIAQYNTINAKLAGISVLFTRHVTKVPQKTLDAFRAELHANLFNASDRIFNTLSKALTHWDQNVRDDLIGNVLQAQRDLLAMIEALDAFGQGTLRLTRRRPHRGDLRLEYIHNGMDIYLVLRPRENSEGQARIGFRIIPHLPTDNGLSHELSFRWDRETPTQTALDIHSDALVRLNHLDRRAGGYHYTLSDNQFAEAEFFAHIVQSFLPS